MANIAINGFGRIGRLFFREAFDKKGLDIVAINDLGDIHNLGYLLQYDSVYRTFAHTVEVVPNGDVVGSSGHLVVNGKKIVVLQEKDPAKLPWKDLDVDVVVESTGVFESFEKASVHVTQAGAKHVVISAPAKDEEGTAGGRTILLGVNDDSLKGCRVSSNGSCTTNATSPVAAVMHESLGILKGFLTTTHAYTASQSLVDSPTKGKDFRRGRAAAVNIVPSTTGAAISVTRAIPDLIGKFDGVALRVPIVTGSVIDFTFLTKKKTTAEEVNDLLKKAATEKRWKGILTVTNHQVVSSDVIGLPAATMVDLRSTKVVDGDLVKLVSWYDNEWGYVVTLVEHVLKASKLK